MTKPEEQKQDRVQALKDRKQADGSLADLSEKIHAMSKQQQDQADPTGAKQIAKTIGSSMKSAVEGLKSEDKLIRKQSLMSLKATRRQLDGIDETVMANKKEITQGLDNILQSSEHQSSTLLKMTEDMSEKFKKTMPTVKGFMGAFLKNSNPLLQVGFNLASDLKGYWSASREQAKKEHDKELDAAAKQLKGIEAVKTSVRDGTAKETTRASQTEKLAKDGNKTAEDLLTAQKAAEAAKNKPQRKPSSKAGEGPLVKRMDAVKVATEFNSELLYAIYDVLSSGKAVNIQGAVSATPLEKVDVNKTKMQFEPITERLDKHSSILERISKDVSGQLKFSRDQVKNTEADALKAKPLKKVLGDRSGKQFKGDDSKKGGLSGLMDGFIGGIKSFFSGVTGMLGGALAVLGKVITKGGGLLKIVMKGTGFLAVLFAVFDFLDGWNKAGDILGKAEGALTLWDKISAGLGMVAEKFLSVFDYLGGFLGFQEGWSKGLATKIGTFLSDFGESVGNVLSEAWSFVKEQFDGLTSPGFWKEKLDKTMEFIKGIPDMVLDFFKSVMRAQLSFIPDSLIPDWVNDSLKPGSKEKKQAPAMTQKASVRTEVPKVYAQEKFAEAKAARKNEAAAQVNPIVNAPIQNNVNAPTNNYYPSALKTRNDDDTFRGRLAY